MRLPLFLLFYFLSISSLEADALMVNKAMFNPSSATYHINKEGVSLELELTEESLEYFSDLYPNSLRKIMGLKSSPIKKRSKLFLQDKLRIRADGKKLIANVISMHGGKKIQKDPKTGEVLKLQPEISPAVLYISINYPFHKQRPKVLQFAHKTSSTLGFILFHKKQAVNDCAYLSSTQELNLNWKDPFYTHFSSNTLKRVYKYPIMGYLYIEPRLVRVQTLIRFNDIQKFTSLNKRYKHLNEDIKTYFLKDKNLVINNKSVSPNLVNIHYFQTSALGLKLIENMNNFDKNLLFVGVSQEYYVRSLPLSLESKWNYFNKYTSKIPFNIIDPVGPYPGFIYKQSPIFKWENLITDKTEAKITTIKVKTGINLDLPILGITRVWNELPSKKEAKKIVEKSLKNIRLAFREKEDKAISLELSRIVFSKNNDLIQKELAKLFAPSVIRGGVGSVQEFGSFEIHRISSLAKNNGFSLSLSGDLRIIAQHWGHNDKRSLRYQFIIDFIEINEQWFIQDFSILDLKDKTS